MTTDQAIRVANGSAQSYDEVLQDERAERLDELYGAIGDELAHDLTADEVEMIESWGDMDSRSDFETDDSCIPF